MDAQTIENEIKRLRNLPQYKSMSDEDIRQRALENLSKKQLDVADLFEKPEEKAEAKQIWNKYIEAFPDFDFAELSILRDLVYEEIYKLNIQRKINENLAKGQNPYKDMTVQLHDVENHINDLKKVLGILKDKEEGRDELSALETLQKRHERNINANKHEYMTYCKHCAKPLLLRRRTKDFVTMKHPWFAGRWYFNYEIIKDVKDGKITKEQAWRYMYSLSTGKDYEEMKQICFDYIDVCIKNWKEIVEHIKNPHGQEE